MQRTNSTIKKNIKKRRILYRNGCYKENVNAETVRAWNTVIFVKQGVLLRGITMLWILREFTLPKSAGVCRWFYGSGSGTSPPLPLLSRGHILPGYTQCNSDSNRRLRLRTRQSLDNRLAGVMERCLKCEWERWSRTVTDLVAWSARWSLKQRGLVSF